jgi:hypothetical protein
MRRSATIYGEHEREGEHNEIKAGTRACHTSDAGIEVMRQLHCYTYKLLHVRRRGRGKLPTSRVYPSSMRGRFNLAGCCFHTLALALALALA